VINRSSDLAAPVRLLNTPPQIAGSKLIAGETLLISNPSLINRLL